MFFRLMPFISAAFLTSLLAATDAVVQVNQTELKSMLESTEKPVIIDVFAPWCGPCKTLAPIFEKFAQENKDRYVCLKINGDTAKDFCKSAGVSGFPTVLVYKNNKLVDKSVGAKEEQAFKATIEEIINSAGKDLNQLSKEQLFTKLQDAIQANLVEDAKKLLDAGADANQNLANGKPPLFFAILYNVVRFGDQGRLMFDLLLSKSSPETLKTAPVDFIEQMIHDAMTISEQFPKVVTALEARAAELHATEKAAQA